jgi:hypothetical protein
MKTLNLDRNFFTQIGLDSGSLTMHGTVVHSPREAGEYRGTVRRGDLPEAVFYISADKNSPVAHVNIDLASLVGDSPSVADCCKGEDKHRFVVNPKGYVVFHVSGGAGGYYVHLRKAEENPETKVFNSRHLDEGDIFAGVLLRPGTYSIKNTVGKGEGQIVVSYPVIAKTAYWPPNPATMEFSAGGISPRELHLQPGQGLNCHVKAPARIKIELLKPDDGPKSGYREPSKGGWQKYKLTKAEA